MAVDGHPLVREGRDSAAALIIIHARAADAWRRPDGEDREGYRRNRRVLGYASYIPRWR